MIKIGVNMKQQSEICKARSLFITRGILNREVIPDQIVYSWVRSKLHNISFELLDVSVNDESINLLSLDKLTSTTMQYMRNVKPAYSVVYLINSNGKCVYQSDDKGFILPQITSFREESIGTTAAGISLSTGENTRVYGCEHYNKALTNYISESYILTDETALNPLIILILTPLMHFVSHDTLYSKILDHYKKENKASSELTDDSINGKKDTVVNPVKSMENTCISDRSEISCIVVENNVCKQFTLSVIEEETIRAAIFHYKWNLKKAAEALGIGRSTLYRKIKEYNINK